MLINGIFTYNQHWVAMMNIINRSRLCPPKEGHKHHIIPRCWFKLKNLEIDNSDKNLVLLSYEDHVKVHKLLYLCTSGITKRKMAYAYHRLTEGEIVENGCFEGRVCSAETRRKMSVARRVCSAETRRKMSVARTGKNHPNFGKTTSDETRRKISESKKSRTSSNKGKTWKLINGKRVWLSKEL